jgi:AcrR family transcriptional regulator
LHAEKVFAYAREMSSATGLRERKKQRTREAIVRVAFELFAERGYQATTLNDIADAAEVSRRTIFAYFPSKEEILFCDFEATAKTLEDALAARPSGMDALQVVREFIISQAPKGEDELDPVRRRIVEQDETLRSRMRARMARMEDLIAAAIADDLGAAEDDLRPHVVAASLSAAFGVISEREAARKRKPRSPDDVARVIDPIIVFLRGGLDALSKAGDL